MIHVLYSNDSCSSTRGFANPKYFLLKMNPNCLSNNGLFDLATFRDFVQPILFGGALGSRDIRPAMIYFRH